MGGVMLQQAHSHYDSHATVLAFLLIRNSQKKTDMEYVIIRYTYDRSISVFLFVIRITSSLSAGVLHVPAALA